MLGLDITNADELQFAPKTIDAVKAYIREIVSTCKENTPKREILEKSAKYWKRLADGSKLSAEQLHQLRTKLSSHPRRRDQLVPYRAVQQICAELQISVDTVSKVAKKIIAASDNRARKEADLITVDYDEFIIRACTLTGEHIADRMKWTKTMLYVYDETGALNMSTQNFLRLFKFFQHDDPTITDEVYALLKQHAAKMDSTGLLMTIEEYESFYETYVASKSEEELYGDPTAEDKVPLTGPSNVGSDSAVTQPANPTSI
jgi:hypothetical protein